MELEKYRTSAASIATLQRARDPMGGRRVGPIVIAENGGVIDG
jgi:hypothetical protein